jgi:outer membrane receptor for ferrienterochelin and colicin
LELEVKKSLETLIGLKNFMLQLNASYIYSKVEFADNATERSRPLQGQSPFVVNAALFYQNDKNGLSSSLVYNVMGKRIMVAAQLNQGIVVVPDIYELPRNVLDFSLNKKIGKKVELKFGIKDILSQNYRTVQTYEYAKDGLDKSSTLTNQSYNSGRIWSLAVNWKF